MFECLSRRLGPTWNGYLRVFLPALLVALGIVGIQALITGGWETAQAGAVVIVGIAAAVLLSMIIADIIICAAEQTGLPLLADPTGSGSPSTGNVDCATAQAALADAQAQAARAETDLEDKTAQVRVAQDFVDNSRKALTLALIGLAAAAFFPWLLPIATTFAATAGLLLWGAAKALGAALADLNTAAAALGAAQKMVAVAETMVAQACSVVVAPTPPGLGTTLNSLIVLAGFHGGHRGRSAS